MAESGIGTLRIPLPGVGVQPPNPLPFLNALEESPPTASTFQQTDPASEGMALETCLVRWPPPGGAERYSDTAVTC